MHSNSTPFEAARTSFEALLAFAASPPEDVGEFEAECMARVMEIGRAMMKHRLEAVGQREAFCQNGVLWRVAVTSSLPVMTLFGRVSVERMLFRARRNGPTRCLVRERAPLVAGFWTERAAKIGALAISEMPMQRAEQFFAAAGCMPASRSSLLRLGGWLSDLWEESREANEHTVRRSAEVPEAAETVTVSLDGVMVLMTDSDKAKKKAAARARGCVDKGPTGWREASVGVVSFYDSEGERLETWRYGRMPEKDKATTKRWLHEVLEHIRKARQDLTVVAIADGAANNWTFLGQLGTDYEVVDFFHTVTHLHQHVSKANGAATLDTQKKLRKMRHDLLEKPGAATRVFNDLQAIREQAGTEAVSTKKKRGKRQPTFFERHKDRMNFADLRAMNLPIGSGVTESTCKLTICDRLRRTGMQWTERGGQAIITLRAHVVSNQFDAAWHVYSNRNRERLAA